MTVSLVDKVSQPMLTKYSYRPLTVGYGRTYSTIDNLPSILFVNGEQGAWYDPSDFSTLFQDAAGTTPVTAVTQPVGLMLDKRLGLALGAEMAAETYATAAGFDNVTTPTSVSSFSTVGGTTASRVYLNITTVVGKWYKVNATIVSVSSGTVQMLARSGSGGGGSNLSATPQLSAGQSVTLYFAATTTSSSILWVSSGLGASYNVSGISIKLLDGNHASQATTANRPVLQQDAGGHYYLAFNGTNSSMATAAINFTATDKMMVVAGLRKLSDAATGSVVELSADSGTNNGSFMLFAPSAASASYRVGVRGDSAVSSYALTTYTAPITNVVTEQLDIAGATIVEEVIPRVNGQTPTKAAVGVGPAGSGNFGTYPLYIGARAGTSVFFNGNLYSLIVRGVQSSTSQVQALEAYVNSKTGAY